MIQGIEWRSIKDTSQLFEIAPEALLLFKKGTEVGYFKEDNFTPLIQENEVTLSHFENYGTQGNKIILDAHILDKVVQGEKYSILAFEEHYTQEDESSSYLTIEGVQKQRVLEYLFTLESKGLGQLEVSSNVLDSDERYAVSNENGFKVYRNNAWKTLANIENSLEELMTKAELESLALEEWNTLDGEVALVSLMTGDEYLTSYTENKFTYDKTPVIKDVRFYILNTTATINLEFTDNILQGELDDADKSSVQYRVLINNENLYPENGEFTALEEPMAPIELQVSSKDIIIGENNTLRVEFKDGWGTMDFWEQTFIGEMRGLLFYDELGGLYSTEIGEVLKTLDFGTITAGTTSQEHKVTLKNLTSGEYENITLNTIIPQELGYEVAQENIDNQKVQFQLSHSDSPFTPNQELKYLSAQPNQEFEFFVRISTSIDATGVQDGLFDIQVIAKPKV